MKATDPKSKDTQIRIRRNLCRTVSRFLACESSDPGNEQACPATPNVIGHA